MLYFDHKDLRIYLRGQASVSLRYSVIEEKRVRLTDAPAGLLHPLRILGYNIP